MRATKSCPHVTMIRSGSKRGEGQTSQRLLRVAIPTMEAEAAMKVNSALREPIGWQTVHAPIDDENEIHT